MNRSTRTKHTSRPSRGHRRSASAQKRPRTAARLAQTIAAEMNGDRATLAGAAPLTLDEFATLTKASREYVDALLREGVFDAALVKTPDGPRIGLAAFPMYLAVH